MPDAGKSSTRVPQERRRPRTGAWRGLIERDCLAVCLLGALFGVALLLFATTVVAARHRQDLGQRRHEVQVVSGSLSRLGRKLVADLSDYAIWDDAVRNLVLDINHDWIASNLDNNIQSTLHYEVNIVFDGNGNIAHGFIESRQISDVSATGLGDDLNTLVRRVQGDAWAASSPEVVALSGSDGAYLAAAMRIVPEPGSELAPPPGPPFVLVFAKRLDSGFLRQLENDFGLPKLMLITADSAVDDRASVELHGPERRLVGRIAWTPRRPGLEQLGWMVPALFGALLASGIFALFAQRGLSITRALRESEARLRDFAEISSDWLWETDHRLRFNWLSSSFESATGLHPQDQLGKTPEQLWHNGGREGDWQPHLADLAARRPFRNFTNSRRDSSGRHRVARVSGKPMFDRSGRFLGYRGTGRDVTEEWDASQRLHESENRFRSLVENLRGIVFCHGAAGDGPHGYDEHGSQVYGADADRLIGTAGENGQVQLTKWFNAVHKDDQAAYMEAERRRRELGEPYSQEYRITHPVSGEERWVREVAWVTVSPDDERHFLDSYIIDVTEQKRATLALQDSELRLHLALSAGGMATWDLDLRTGLEVWNDVHYELFGVDPATFTPSSATFDAMLDPRDIDRLRARMDTAFANRNEAVFSNDYRIIRPDGATRWISGVGRVLRSATGRAERVLGVNFDITERKERELELEAAHARLAEQTALLERRNRELEAANQAKSRFVANVSHEIRTPMNAVLGFADLLAEAGLEPAQLRYVEIIRDTGRQLLTLLNDILDVAKLEAGRLDLERIDFSLEAVVEQVRSLLAPQAVERGLALRVELAAPAGLVLRGDPTRLRQVLVNLIGNGLKFTSRGGVTLGVRPVAGAAGRLRFEVTDTGIGIPRERQGELFQPFVQADSSTTRLYGGTGLGLMICRSLVTAMGGEIGLESEPGRGSRFWFELPVERGDAVVAERSGLAAAPIRPLVVLVADDVAANRELLGEILRRQGHTVRFAEDGAVAVAVTAEAVPDVVLMDIQMPVVDGIEATRRIRRLPGAAGRVPILALTANVMADDRERYLKAGMDRCLTKPVIWPELFAALAAVAGDAAPAAAAPEPAPAPPAAPLLDRAMLAGLAANLPPGALGKLVGRGLDGADASCRRLLAARDDPKTLAAEAHRLRGTAGSFGLARISALAGQIEDRLRHDQDVADLLRDLEQAVPASRREFEQLDSIAAT